MSTHIIPHFAQHWYLWAVEKFWSFFIKFNNFHLTQGKMGSSERRQPPLQVPFVGRGCLPIKTLKWCKGQECKFFNGQRIHNYNHKLQDEHYIFESYVLYLSKLSSICLTRSKSNSKEIVVSRVPAEGSHFQLSSLKKEILRQSWFSQNCSTDFLKEKLPERKKCAFISLSKIIGLVLVEPEV